MEYFGVLLKQTYGVLRVLLEQTYGVLWCTVRVNPVEFFGVLLKQTYGVLWCTVRENLWSTLVYC